MKRYITLFAVFCCSSVFAQNYDKSDIRNYIDTYSGIAVKKMQEHQIPASITLAQGILESAAGKSELAINANNHFGIKCHKSWDGKTYHKDDDAKSECFRRYKSAIESFEDHSQFLQASRYADLFTLEITDYQGWAHGLKKAGYATNPQYAQRLIRIIEEYNLAIYDQKDAPPLLAGNNNIRSNSNKKETTRATSSKRREAGKVVETQSQQIVINDGKQQNKQSNEFEIVQQMFNGFSPVDYPYTSRLVYSNNGSYFIVVQEGDTFYKIAKDVQLGVGELKSYNDVPGRKYEPCEGEIIYLQRKKPYAEAHQHILRSNETLRSVAQQYGCRLNSIYKLNKLNKSEIAIEEGLRLQLRK